MKTVRIIKNWTEPNFFRQTHNSRGVWNGIYFTNDPVEECDYVIVLNYSPKKVIVRCPKENVWCLLQDPPNEFFKPWHRASQVFFRVFTQDPSLKGSRFIQSQPALPWHINKTYDFLVKSKIPKKESNLSWITSFKRIFYHHKKRLKFLKTVQNQLSFDLVATNDYYSKQMPDKTQIEIKNELFKKGYNKIVNGKWEGLAPYKYTMVIENFHGPYYWSEKLADAFLSFSLPIYYGCTNIIDYFPKGSLIQIDIENPNVPKIIKNAIRNNLWEKNIEKIKHARERILQRYQFFPFMVNYIKEWEMNSTIDYSKRDFIEIPKGNTLLNQLANKIKRFLMF